MAKLCGAKLTLVHVADGFAARLQEQLNLSDSEEVLADRGYLLSLEAQLKQEGFAAEAVLGKGDPGTEILNLAHKRGVDLIAMSTHGHTVLMDLLLGSVAEQVRHRTSIPVLMLRGNEP